jgi:hypothetical protein
MPFPCLAVPLSVKNVSLTLDLHSAAVSDSHLLRRAHAMLCPCRFSQGHGKVRQSRDGLWAACPLSGSSGYHAEFREVVTRSISISDSGGQCETKHRLSWTRKRAVAAHYKEDDLFHCWTNRSDISGYHAEFREVVIRSISISDAGGQCETKQHLSWTRKRVVAAHYKKDDLFHCWTSRSEISGYHADFREGHSTVGAGQERGMACVN